MISTTSVISSLHEWRRDKLALVALLAMMGSTDGTTKSAADKLESLLPAIADAKKEFSKGKNKDLATRVDELATDLYPWLRDIDRTERDE